MENFGIRLINLMIVAKVKLRISVNLFIPKHAIKTIMFLIQFWYFSVIKAKIRD